MKISNPNVSGALKGINQSSSKEVRLDAGKPTKGSKKSENLGDSVKVNLSEKAKNIQKVKESIGDINQVDEAKVAKFRDLIDSGKYEVDAGKVADKLVDDHLDFPY